MSGPLVVVMGVSGSGKSTVGRVVADRLGAGFVDADDLHPASNVAKMHAGVPLTDEDRAPWLALVGRTLADAGDSGMAIACSALKRAYRDLIRAEAPGAVFVELDGSRELLAARLAERQLTEPGHFMPPSLLDSQLATLEPLAEDEPGVRVDIAPPLEDIVGALVRLLPTRIHTPPIPPAFG